MNAIPKPFPSELSELRGLSPTLLRSHHENNYLGAVRRLNAIRAALTSTDFQVIPGFELNGLKREELIAANSMLLHEVYFASLGGAAEGVPPPMGVALAASFGSVERWQSEFAAMARALSGGSGWVLLTYSEREGVLTNQWASDHTQTLSSGVPILALDMYEHAYHIDFGARATAYVEAFMANIRWKGVHQRYQRVVHAAAEPYEAAHDKADEAVLLDVRRAGAFEQATEIIPGAQWRDPALVGMWAEELPVGQKVIVYCVAGHEMSRGTAMRLRAAGIDAEFLSGGIDGWRAGGRPLSAKSMPSSKT
jgi:superoxide dismutase, Fe-Mn family